MQEVHFFEYVDCFNEAVAPFNRWANRAMREVAMMEVTIGISHRNVIILVVIATGRGPHIIYTPKKLHRIWCERKLSFSKSIIRRATTQWQGNVVERIVGWTSKNWANDSDTTTKGVVSWTSAVQNASEPRSPRMVVFHLMERKFRTSAPFCKSREKRRKTIGREETFPQSHLK